MVVEIYSLFDMKYQCASKYRREIKTHLWYIQCLQLKYKTKDTNLESKNEEQNLFKFSTKKEQNLPLSYF